MKRQFLSLVATLTLASLAPLAPRAEDVDTSNHADTVRVSLSPYSIGLGAGAFSPFNTELRDESYGFMKLSLVQSIAFGTQWNLGLDADLFFPGGDWGGDLTVNYLLGQGAVRPFIGAGGGFHYFDAEGREFGDGFGPSGIANIGLFLDVMDELQMRVRVPFHAVANRYGDHGIGLDVAFLFGNPLRTKRVEKLVY